MLLCSIGEEASPSRDPLPQAPGGQEEAGRGPPAAESEKLILITGAWEQPHVAHAHSSGHAPLPPAARRPRGEGQPRQQGINRGSQCQCVFW